MKKTYIVWVALAYLLAGCHAGTSTHDGDGEMHENEEGYGHADGTHAGEVSFSKNQADAAGIRTQRVMPGTFTDVIKASGRIMAAQGDESTVVATVSGVVALGRLPFVEGTPVRKGEPILTLTSANLPEGDVAVRTKSAYEKAAREYERMQSLIGDRIVSAKEFEQARSDYENAEAAWKAVEGKQTAGGVSVISPQSGYLKNLRVKEGDYVAVGQPIATVTRNSRLLLRAEVSERYYSSLSAVRSAHFRTPYDGGIYRLSDLHGRLISCGRSSDTDAFYIPVTFEFDNKGNIIPGSFVEIYLLTAPMENVIHIPVSALVEEQGIYSVYVREHEEIYRKAAVKPGTDDGREVQILDGLKAGDEVVTEGAYQIRLASATNAIPAHTHNH